MHTELLTVAVYLQRREKLIPKFSKLMYLLQYNLDILNQHVLFVYFKNQQKKKEEGDFMDSNIHPDWELLN